ncbi:Cytochrome b5 isoform A-like protein [Drosera capensis]
MGSRRYKVREDQIPGQSRTTNNSEDADIDEAVQHERSLRAQHQARLLGRHRWKGFDGHVFEVTGLTWNWELNDILFVGMWVSAALFQNEGFHVLYCYDVVSLIQVYDVSTYLDEHPGGDDVVLEVTGKDSIEEFEDAGHSEEARDLLETFFIGELDPSATLIPEASSREDTVAKPKEWALQYWAIPVAVVGISMVVGFLYLRKR